MIKYEYKGLNIIRNQNKNKSKFNKNVYSADILGYGIPVYP